MAGHPDEPRDPGVPPSPVHAVASVSGEGTEWWFAATTEGLRRSSDGGQTWSDCYGSLDPQAPIPTLVIAPEPAPSSAPCLLAGVVGGVLRSDNWGESWSVFEAPPPPAVFTSVAYSPGFARDGLAFAGTMEDGVFRSDDRGRTWAAWNFGLLDLAVLDVIAHRAGSERPSPSGAPGFTLLAATETGVFRSTNGGRAWRETGFPADTSAVLCLAATETAVFAGTESDGLYRSDDGGASWHRLDGLPSGSVNSLTVVSSSAVGPIRLLALIGNALYQSPDSGQSWAAAIPDREIPGGVSSFDLRPSHPDDQPGLLVGLVDGGVLSVDLRGG